MKKRSVAEVATAIGVPTRLDFVRWQQFLATVDYKPGWGFELIDLISRKGAIAVRIRMLVYDTREDRDLKPIAVVTDYQVPEWLLGDRFDNPLARFWILGRLYEVEKHEVEEWLRFDGEQTFNPHGPPQQRGRRPDGWEWLAPPEIKISPTIKEKAHG